MRRLLTKDVMQVLNQIENFGNMQMICLMPLAKYYPLNHQTETKKDGEMGGFVGLLPAPQNGEALIANAIA